MHLHPLRYEFPHAASRPSDGDDWDANWLIIRGEVRTKEGETWGFEQPCLTTWEAQSLGSWLRSVALKDAVLLQLEAFVEADLYYAEGLESFTEPNVAFSVAAYGVDAVLVRVHLSLESLPPRLEADTVELYSHCVVLEVALADVSRAAETWDEELREFPPR